MFSKIALTCLLSYSFINAKDIRIKEDVGGDLYEFTRKDIKDSILSEKDLNLRDYYYKIKNREGCFFEKDSSVEVLTPLTDGFYLVKDTKKGCTDYINKDNLYDNDVNNELLKQQALKEDELKEKALKELQVQKELEENNKKEIVNYNVYVIATYLKETQANNFIKNKLNGIKTNLINNKGIYTLEIYLKENDKEKNINFVKNLSKDGYFKRIESIEENKQIH